MALPGVHPLEGGTVTLPGELCYDPAAREWYARCARCGRGGRYTPRSRTGRTPEGAAAYLRRAGWRCVEGQWVCRGCWRAAGAA